MKSGDSVKKTVKTVHNFIVFVLTLCLVVLRTVQLCFYTDKSGCIVKGAENTIIVFYCCALFLFISVLIYFFQNRKSAVKDELTFPFKDKSRILCITSAAAGVSMFCDFIFRIIISYNYISGASYTRLNYFVPLCISAVFSFLCAFYFNAVSISFHSDKYVFGDFKYLHIIPLLWTVSVLVTCLTENVDVIYAEEKLLHYIVLILAIVFFVLFITSSEGLTDLTALYAFGVAYGAFAIVISAPRMIAFFYKVSFNYTDFSSVPYLFTGIFALVVSKFISGQKKKDS